jgi:DNA modification methylase
MPESVADRPTKAHENIFLLSKASKYFYDAEAIKEPAICGDPRKPYAPGQVDVRGDGHARGGGKIRPTVLRGGFNGKTEAMADEGRNAFRSIKDWRNKRSVWTIAPKPFKGAHFAVFPPALVEPMILAGCPPGGIVLDPFAGAGTTSLVAERLGRNSIGVDPNPAYCKMAKERIEKDRGAR